MVNNMNLFCCWLILWITVTCHIKITHNPSQCVFSVMIERNVVISRWTDKNILNLLKQVLTSVFSLLSINWKQRVWRKFYGRVFEVKLFTLYYEQHSAFIRIYEKYAVDVNCKPLGELISVIGMFHLPGGQGPQVRDPLVLVQSTLGLTEQPPLFISHSLISTQENPLPE